MPTVYPGVCAPNYRCKSDEECHIGEGELYQMYDVEKWDGGLFCSGDLYYGADVYKAGGTCQAMYAAGVTCARNFECDSGIYESQKCVAPPDCNVDTTPPHCTREFTYCHTPDEGSYDGICEPKLGDKYNGTCSEWWGANHEACLTDICDASTGYCMPERPKCDAETPCE